MKVKTAMVRNPITISPEASVGTALEVMRTKGIRHLPVVDETGLLVGVVTDRDLRHAALAPALEQFLPVRVQRQGRRIARVVENLSVRDVMTWAVVTTTPEAPVLYAALVMVESRVGSLPVVENGHLVGLLTEHDVLKALMREENLAEFGAGYLW
jgi:acetoin utilization protein AcuB